MKNTIEVILNIGDDEIVIEGKCPNCMTNNELKSFIKGMTIINLEIVKEIEKRNLYGKKKQGSQKKR